MRAYYFIALVVILSSCIATTQFTAKTQTGHPIALDTLNLLSVMIGPVLQPMPTFIRTSAISGEKKSTAEKIMDTEAEIINTIRQDLVQTLKESLPCEVRTSKDFTTPGMNPYRVHTSVPNENKNFPIVFFGEGDMNFQEFGKLNNLTSELKSNQTMRESIAAFAQKFNLTNVAICYYRLAVFDFNTYSRSRTARLESYLLIFDRRGNLALEATGILLPTDITGQNIDEYAAELNRYRTMHSMLAIPLSRKFLD